MRAAHRPGRRVHRTALGVVLASAAFAAATPLAPAVGIAAAEALPMPTQLWTWGQGRGGMAGGVSPNAAIPWPLTSGGHAWIDVATNGFHTVALDADGTVWTWGNNDSGQLGDGTTQRRLLPVRIAGLTGVDTVAAGFQHCLAYRRADESVWAWGSNAAGQLGRPSADLPFSATPLRVDGLPAVRQLVAAGAFNLALDADGAVWSWGDNRYGQLGPDAPSSRSTPSRVSGLPAITSVGAGSNHSLAVDDNGGVWGWGWNVFGQLGRGYQDRPGDSAPDPARVIELVDAIAVAGGDVHSLALTRNGNVWAWGYNTEGQVGNGQSTPADRGVLIPARLVGISDVESIDAGGIHSVALSRDGDVFSWGSNLDGECGTNHRSDERSPARVEGLRGVRLVRAGSKHSVAIAGLRPPASLRWYGEVERRAPPGTQGAPSSEYAGVLAGPEDVTRVSVGKRHGLLIDGESRVWQWGQGADGTFREHAEAVNLPLDDTNGFVQVAAGNGFSIALRADGKAWTWGDGSRGELGTGDLTLTVTAQEIVGLPEVAAIAAGEHHVLAQDINGTLWAWGDNTHGQLGRSPGDDPIARPVRVSGVTSAISIAAGAYHNLALTSSITLFAWGDNRFAQLGIESNAPSATAVAVPLPFGVTTFSAGNYHSLVILQGGQVWAFGDVADCQTGWASRFPYLTPRRVDGVAEARLVAAGGYHSLALGRKDVVFAWGNDSRGQLALFGPERHEVCRAESTGRQASFIAAADVYSALVSSESAAR